MAKKYHPTRLPVLELYARVYEDPNSGGLVLQVSKSLGLNESMVCYQDRCSVPVASSIVGELETVFTELLENEVTARWGIQTAVIEFFPPQ